MLVHTIFTTGVADTALGIFVCLFLRGIWLEQWTTHVCRVVRRGYVLFTKPVCCEKETVFAHVGEDLAWMISNRVERRRRRRGGDDDGQTRGSRLMRPEEMPDCRGGGRVGVQDSRLTPLMSILREWASPNRLFPYSSSFLQVSAFAVSPERNNAPHRVQQ